MIHRKIIVKISYPVWWDGMGSNILAQTPAMTSKWSNYQFEINNQIKECDYWFIFEDHSIYLHESAICPPENCVLITNEEKSMWTYPLDYLRQFGKILTSRDDIDHKCVIRTQHLAPWHVRKSYDFLKKCAVPDKVFNLSSITSDAVSLEGHRKRYKLLNRLKGHFKDQLHWFGKGEHPIEDKWDGLALYKYSIAIENSCHLHYFTEKIIDCFLSFTMPIYWGCPNIETYFPPESLVLITDLDDYKRVISQIEEAIEEKRYEKNYIYLLQARSLVLDRYQIFPFLSNWLDIQDLDSKILKKEKVIIKSKRYYTSKLTVKQRMYAHYQYLMFKHNSNLN